MYKLGDLADICRSKNAGPYILTVDFLFDSQERYEKIKASNAIANETIAKLYGVTAEQVSVNYFDIVKAIKVSVPRQYSSGSFHDSDVFGAQQHTPLCDMELDIQL